RHIASDSAASLAQRNSALKLGDRSTIAPWTAQLAVLGGALVEARVGLLDLLRGPFGEAATQLGLPEARLEYEGEPATEADLEARLERDLERGSTGAGPPLHDISILSVAPHTRAVRSHG